MVAVLAVRSTAVCTVEREDVTEHSPSMDCAFVVASRFQGQSYGNTLTDIQLEIPKASR